MAVLRRDDTALGQAGGCRPEVRPPLVYKLILKSNVATAPALSVSWRRRPWNSMVKPLGASVLFSTMSTPRPRGVWNATLGSWSSELEAIRDDSGITYFEAWATI